MNLAYAVDRVLARTDRDYLAEANAIHAEQRDVDARIGRFGAELLPRKGNVMTHCNAGPIATGGEGTALAAIIAAHNAGKSLHVYVDETRPLLQGARLTMFELRAAGVPCTLITDSAAAVTMQRKKVDAIIVGADRIARNGDTANKIGTYGLAIVAAHHGVPFYVAAPRSTFDFEMASGMEIPIEERWPDEIRIAPDDPAYNPAFDVTPGRLDHRHCHRIRGIRAAVRRLHRRPRNPRSHSRRVKYYDFLDKSPKIDGLVVIEGTDSLLAQRALDVLLDRLIPPDMRELNLEVIAARPAGLTRTRAESVSPCRSLPSGAWSWSATARRCARNRAATSWT